METKTKSTITLFDRANSKLQNIFFSIVTTIRCAFSPAMNKSLHAALVNICTSRGDPLSLLPLLKCTIPPHCADIHCLISINVQHALMNVSGCHHFCTEEFSDTALIHMRSHARLHSVRLPLCCHLSHGNNM